MSAPLVQLQAATFRCGLAADACTCVDYSDAAQCRHASPVRSPGDAAPAHRAVARLRRASRVLIRAEIAHHEARNNATALLARRRARRAFEAALEATAQELQSARR